jgi:broad specificity phosphatase PhoE
MCQHRFRKALLTFLFVVIWLQAAPVNAQTSSSGGLPLLIVIVRHADRASQPANDPPLTEAGSQRAQDLATSLRDAKFTAIITTQYLRVRQTAQPIAAVLGITPEVLSIRDVNNRADQEVHIKELLSSLRNKAGGSVLVVDHGNMIPDMIGALGGPRLPVICDPVYDHLFVVVPTHGTVQLVSSRYGALSPPAGSDCM